MKLTFTGNLARILPSFTAFPPYRGYFGDELKLAHFAFWAGVVDEGDYLKLGPG